MSVFSLTKPDTVIDISNEGRTLSRVSWNQNKVAIQRYITGPPILAGLIYKKVQDKI